MAGLTLVDGAAKLLVTGITGFLGGRLLQAVESDGGPVMVIGVGRDERVLESRARAASAAGMHAIDLAAPSEGARLEAVVAAGRPTAVVHLAALVPSPADDGARAAETYRANTAATVRLWAALASLAPESRPGRFVLASSVLVYGWPRPGPLDEGHDVRPRDHYGVSKLGAELFSRYMASRLGVELVVLRLGYIYGPGDRSGKVVDRFLRQADAGHDIIVSASPGDFRDYVFVDDVVRCLLAAAVTGAVEPALVNVSSGVPTTPRELASTARDVTGSTSTISERTPSDGGALEGYGSTLMDTSLGASLFGPWTRLEDGLNATLRELRHG